MQRGEYYYYTSILKRKDSTDLFKEVTVPETWTEEHTGQQLGITVQAEAIQAANFNPDFKAMSPWGNQEIQLCVHEENGTTVCRKEKQNCQWSLTDRLISFCLFRVTFCEYGNCHAGR